MTILYSEFLKKIKRSTEYVSVPGDRRDKEHFAMEERVQMKIKSRRLYT